MKKLITHFKFFSRFIIIGVLNTGFSFAVYSFYLMLGLHYALANLFALIIGTIFSFKTQGAFVFKNKDPHLFYRFISAWLILYIINILFIREAIAYGFNAYTSGALAIVPITMCSFIIQRFFVFKKLTVKV